MNSKYSGLTFSNQFFVWIKLNLFFFIGIYQLQVLSKLIFVLSSFPLSNCFSVFLETIRYGFGMDIAITASFFLFISILNFLNRFYPLSKMAFGLLLGILLIQVWVLIADINFFHFWRWRIQSQAFDYLKDFQIVANTLPAEIWIYTFLLVVFSILGIRWMILKQFENFQKWFESVPSFSWKNPINFILWGLMFILIRGGVGPSVRTWGDVMKSNNIDVSVASMNGLWNFGYVLSSPSKDDQVKQILVSKDWENVACKQYKGNLISPEELKKTWFRHPNNPPKYCFLIILEGINAQWIENTSMSFQLLTKWRKELTYFDQCYAVGDRTDKGLAAVLTGWPGEPGKGILHDPYRWKYLKGLPQILRASGWNSNFVYGGDAQFSNMDGFMKQIGMNEIHDQSNMNINSGKIKWGFTDKDVGDWLSSAYLPNIIQANQSENQKQLTVWMQLASHEPFDVVNTELGMLEKYKISMKHSDSAVSAFLMSIKKMGVWDESLVVVISDHGRDLGLKSTQNPCEFFRIPLFIGGGVVNSRTLADMSHQICSQPEVYATLSFLLTDTQNNGQFKSDYFAYPWNRVLAPESGVKNILCFNGERSVLLGDLGFSEGMIESHKAAKNLADTVRVGIQSKIIHSFFRF